MIRTAVITVNSDGGVQSIQQSDCRVNESEHRPEDSPAGTEESKIKTRCFIRLLVTKRKDLYV